MLTRRTLMATSAGLAAGCSSLESSFSVPSLPKDVELTWGLLGFIGLFEPGRGGRDPETKLRQMVVALEEDTENPNGPTKDATR